MDFFCPYEGIDSWRKLHIFNKLFIKLKANYMF